MKSLKAKIATVFSLLCLALSMTVFGVFSSLEPYKNDTTGQLGYIDKTCYLQSSDGTIKDFYSTVNKAYSSAADGDTICVFKDTALKDTALSSVLYVKKNVTIQASQNVTVSGSLIVSAGELTLGGGSGTLTIANAITMDGGNMTVQDGASITGTDVAANGQTYNTGIAVLNPNSTLTMTGGSVSSTGYGIHLTAGSAKITGGSISATNTDKQYGHAILNEGMGSVDISGTNPVTISGSMCGISVFNRNNPDQPSGGPLSINNVNATISGGAMGIYSYSTGITINAGSIIVTESVTESTISQFVTINHAGSGDLIINAKDTVNITTSKENNTAANTAMSLGGGGSLVIEGSAAVNIDYSMAGILIQDPTSVNISNENLVISPVSNEIGGLYGALNVAGSKETEITITGGKFVANTALSGAIGLGYCSAEIGGNVQVVNNLSAGTGIVANGERLSINGSVTINAKVGISKVDGTLDVANITIKANTGISANGAYLVLDGEIDIDGSVQISQLSDDPVITIGESFSTTAIIPLTISSPQAGQIVAHYENATTAQNFNSHFSHDYGLYLDDSNYLHIGTLVTAPTQGTSSFEYTGSAHTYTPSGFDDTTMNISGNVQTDVGNYQATVSLDGDKYLWKDTLNRTSKPFKWSITKADLLAPDGLIWIPSEDKSSATARWNAVPGGQSYTVTVLVNGLPSDLTKTINSTEANFTSTELNALDNGTYTFTVQAIGDSNHNNSSVSSASGNLYKLTFNANYSGGATTTQYYKSGETISAPTLSRANYIFVGWATTNTATTPNIPATPSSSTTYYAIWDAIEYNVYFYYADGTLYNNGDYYLNNLSKKSEDWIQVEGKTDSIKLKEPTPVVYGAEYGIRVPKGYSVLIEYIVDGSVVNTETFTATNSATSATLSYKADYLDVTLTKISGNKLLDPEDIDSSNLSNLRITHYSNPFVYTIGDDYCLPNVEMAGYIFDGWYTEPELTNEITSFGTSTLKNLNLYSKFTPIEYTLYINMRRGGQYDDDGTIVSGSDDYALATGHIGETVTLNIPERLGYTFEKWEQEPGYKGNMSTDGTTFTFGAGDAKYIADWTANKYILTYQYNGGMGYDSNGSEINSVTMSYNSEYKQIENANYSHTDLPKAVREGYTFKGWFADEALTKQVNIGDVFNENTATFVNINENGTAAYIYAKWTINSYTLTADANGGTIPATSDWAGSGDTVTKTLTHGQEYGTLPEPTWYAHTFDGWFTAPTGGTQVSASTTITGDTTIYAQWTAVTVYNTVKDKYYTDINTALSDANTSGDTLELLVDIPSLSLNTTKTITIKVGTRDVTINGSIHVSTGTLTLAGNSSGAMLYINGTISVAGGYAGPGQYENGSLIIEDNVKMDAGTSTAITQGSSNNTGGGNITINGGTIYGNTVLQTATSSQGNIQINGGVLSGTQYGIRVLGYGGSIDINGGNINSIYLLGANISLDGDVQIGSITFNNAGGTYLTIEDNFNPSKVISVLANMSTTDLTVAVYGSTQLAQNWQDHFVSGTADMMLYLSGQTLRIAYAAVQNTNTSKIYLSLTSAISEAEAGQELVILKDLTSTETYTVNKDLTILANSAVTVSGQIDVTSGTLTLGGGSNTLTIANVVTLNGGNLTVANGTSITGGGVAYPNSQTFHSGIGVLNANSTLTIKGGTVSGEKYGIRVNAGSANISGGTLNTTGDEASTIFVMNDSSVTISGSANITGYYGVNVRGELSMTGGTIDAELTGIHLQSAAVVSVTNGTISGGETGIYCVSSKTNAVNISGSAKITGATGINNTSSGTVTISGGTINVVTKDNSSVYGIYNSNGVLTMTDGTINVTGENSYGIYNGSTAYLYGGSISAEYCCVENTNYTEMKYIDLYSSEGIGIWNSSKEAELTINEFFNSAAGTMIVNDSNSTDAVVVDASGIFKGYGEAIVNNASGTISISSPETLEIYTGGYSTDSVISNLSDGIINLGKGVYVSNGAVYSMSGVLNVVDDARIDNISITDSLLNISGSPTINRIVYDVNLPSSSGIVNNKGIVINGEFAPTQPIRVQMSGNVPLGGQVVYYQSVANASNWVNQFECYGGILYQDSNVLRWGREIAEKGPVYNAIQDVFYGSLTEAVQQSKEYDCLVILQDLTKESTVSVKNHLTIMSNKKVYVYANIMVCENVVLTIGGGSSEMIFQNTQGEPILVTDYGSSTIISSGVTIDGNEKAPAVSIKGGEVYAMGDATITSQIVAIENSDGTLYLTGSPTISNIRTYPVTPDSQSKGIIVDGAFNPTSIIVLITTSYFGQQLVYYTSPLVAQDWTNHFVLESQDAGTLYMNIQYLRIGYPKNSNTPVHDAFYGQNYTNLSQALRNLDDNSALVIWENLSENQVLLDLPPDMNGTIMSAVDCTLEVENIIISRGTYILGGGAGTLSIQGNIILENEANLIIQSGVLVNGIITNLGEGTIKMYGGSVRGISNEGGGYLYIYGGSVGGISNEGGGYLYIYGGLISAIRNSQGIAEIYGGSMNSIRNDDLLTIYDAEITLAGQDGITNKGVTVINGGTITGNGLFAAIRNSSGRVEFNGGIINMTSTAQESNDELLPVGIINESSDSRLVINGGTITVNAIQYACCIENQRGYIEINSGTISINDGKENYAIMNNKGELIINGGNITGKY